MAKKLKFNDFKEAIKDKSFPFEILNEYVEFDTDSAIPKLIIIPDYIIDDIPADYDVDTEIYNYSIESEKLEHQQKGMFRFSSKRKRIVAEGDSWFRLPPAIRPKSIASRIKSNGKYKVKNIAFWGHTIESIYDKKQYMRTISHKTDYFLLSGGGNDLQNALKNEDNSIIEIYDSNRALDDYLTKKGKEVLNGIERHYRKIIDEVLENFPDIKIFCHAYDFPRPLVGKGKYIGKYLHNLKIPDELKKPIMVEIINNLNSRISMISNDYNNVTYIDCRDITEAFTWIDDMHPGKEGFKALASLFEDVIN